MHLPKIALAAIAALPIVYGEKIWCQYIDDEWKVWVPDCSGSPTGPSNPDGTPAWCTDELKEILLACGAKNNIDDCNWCKYLPEVAKEWNPECGGSVTGPTNADGTPTWCNNILPQYREYVPDCVARNFLADVSIQEASWCQWVPVASKQYVPACGGSEGPPNPGGTPAWCNTLDDGAKAWVTACGGSLYGPLGSDGLPLWCDQIQPEWLLYWPLCQPSDADPSWCDQIGEGKEWVPDCGGSWEGPKNSDGTPTWCTDVLKETLPLCGGEGCDEYDWCQYIGDEEKKWIPKCGGSVTGPTNVNGIPKWCDNIEDEEAMKQLAECKASTSPPGPSPPGPSPPSSGYMASGAALVAMTVAAPLLWA